MDLYLHLFLISVLDGGQLNAPAALPPGKKTPEPIRLETGWGPTNCLEALEKKKSCPEPMFELRIVQYVATVLTRPSHMQWKLKVVIIIITIITAMRWVRHTARVGI
jgi:hypothetical protein